MEFTKDFFNLILNFGGEWAITGIESDHRKQQVYIDLEYISEYKDPDTLEPAKLYDNTEVRVWRHLDILHYQTCVRCRIPRVLCSDGNVRQIAIGRAGKYDRHTYHFESRVIDLLKATKNQAKTAEFMRCGFRLVNRIMHRCTERGDGTQEYIKSTL